MLGKAVIFVRALRAEVDERDRGRGRGSCWCCSVDSVGTLVVVMVLACSWRRGWAEIKVGVLEVGGDVGIEFDE